ncbi:hypothetical protein [Salinisphaera sp. T5B8]|uniref:hypothetical protein n=1 Tax=Salinisphaera sp. T5B8 TaxID=1304154 RepID=UPI0002120E23
MLMATGLQLLIGVVALAVGAPALDTSWEVAGTMRFGASLFGLVVFGTAHMIVLRCYLLARAPT